MSENEEKWLGIREWYGAWNGKKDQGSLPLVLKKDGEMVTMEEMAATGLPRIRGLVSVEYRNGVAIIQGDSSEFQVVHPYHNYLMRSPDARGYTDIVLKNRIKEDWAIGAIGAMWSEGEVGLLVRVSEWLPRMPNLKVRPLVPGQ